MKQKIYSLFIAFAISIATLFASDTKVGGIWYDFDSNTQTASVTYRGSSYSSFSDRYTGAVVIPSSVTYNNTTYSVTSIGNSAFRKCSGLTSVTIPNSVTSIGEYAFYWCFGLTSVTIPNSVTSIGSNAFRECSGLTSVIIGNSVTSIGDRAFYSCTGLTSVEIGNSVTSIGLFAFDGCSGLTSVEIPNSVTSIGEGAFSGCSGLTSVIIPNSVTSIGDYAFYNCSGLTSVEIPNSVTSIGNRAFSGCSKLTSPVYNAHVFACMPTSYSGTYVIPDGIESIAGGAFQGCSDLTSVTIPNSVTSIGSNAFRECSGLTSVKIPNSVTSIGGSAFRYCSSLPVIDNIRYADTYLVEAVDRTLTSYNIKEGTKWIGSFAFENCSKLTSVEIPNSVTSIGNRAFYDCSGLTSVTIPNSVTSIGNSAFYNCSGLTSVTIGNSVTSIGDEAFLYCSGLTSVTIGNSVISIGDEAFYGCSKLTSVTCLGEIPATLGNDVFSSCNNLNAINVPCGTLDAYKNTWSSFASKIKYLNFEYKLIGNVNIQEAGDVILPQNVCDGTLITAIPNYGYHFVQWSDSVTDNPRSFVLTQDTTFTAIFAKNTYSIIKQAIAEQGTITGKSQAEYLDSVTLNAIPNYGYHFTQWSDGITDNPRSFVLTQDTTFTAEFAKNEYTITVTSTNPEWGTTTGDTTALYIDTIAISAISNYGYHFVQWSDGVTDNPRSFVLTQDTTFTAIFAKNTYSITKQTIAEQGTITGKSQAEYLDSVILNAIPNYGYHFTQWSDGNTENPRTIVLTQDTTFTAEFAKNEYTITVTSTNPEWATTTGDTTALYLDTIAISAISNYGYHFVEWNDGNTENPRTIVLTQDTTFTAIFAKNNYSITKQAIAEQGTITGKSQADYLDSVILNAIPNYGYHFVQWSDGVTDNPRSFVLTQDTTFTALFGIDTEGACGDDNLLTWTFDSINHVLSISGEGALNSNYTFGVQAPTQTDTLIIAEGVTAIGKSAFKGMSPTLSSVTFANTVSSIGDYAFAGCQKIDYLALPSSLKSIGSYAFKDLAKIKLLNLPNEVEKIGEHAFDSCILVTSIYLGNAVEEIGDYAFKGCIRVNDITCMNITTPVVYENTLTSISPLAYLFVQAGSKRTYQLDPYWSRFDIHEITTDETTVTTDSVIIDAHDDYVVITWPTNDAASTYTIVITKNGAVFCTLTFNAEGQLTGIAFAPSRSGNAHAPYAMEVANGLQFTVTGLDVASKYEYGLTAADENARALVTYHGEFATSGYQGEINPGGEAEKHIFRIRFLNWDGTELQASDVFEGDVPQYNGITPVREDDEQYTYTFAGWTPEIVAVVAEAIYTATYTATPKTEGIEEVDGENSIPRKVVINGQIYILRGDKMYTIQGQEVK